MLVPLAQSLLESPLNQWIQSVYWLWPVLEITHFIGLSLLLGGLILIDLRLAGHFRGLDIHGVHRLLPFVILGFGLNLLTGILFFFGDPMRYAINIGFQVKMILVMLAGLNALVYYWKVNPLLVDWSGDDSSPSIARIVAYASLALWTGVLLCGRLIPYVGTG